MVQMGHCRTDMMHNKLAFPYRMLKRLGSLKLTVLVLSLIAFLVIAGTVCQAQSGLYAAQQRVFNSWVFWLFGVLPLPGMLLAGVLFLLNLLAALATHFSWHRPPLGMLLIHIGLLLLAGGGFFIAATAQESFLTLREGESGGFSSAASDWEIAMEAPGRAGAPAWAMEVSGLVRGRGVTVADSGIVVTLEARHENCRWVAAGAGEAPRLEPLAPEADPAENTPGLCLLVRSGRETRRVLLCGGDDGPTILDPGGAAVALSLRLKRFALPLKLKLLDFKRTLHAGSEIPKSFESLVEIDAGGIRRRALISMNRPLRFREFTFYQSSYGEDPQQGESSTFSVVRSAGRWLPYAASALMFLGLAVHFLGLLLAGPRRSRGGSAAGKSAGLLLLLLACAPPRSALQAATPSFIEPFQRLVILDQGRIKPMDTYARNLLKQFSGRSSQEGMNAAGWLARVFFSPWETHDDRIFLVNHPDVLSAIGMPAQGRGRYSFRQLQPHLNELQDLAVQATRQKDGKLSGVESEIVRLFYNVSAYYHLARAFHFAWSGAPGSPAAGREPLVPAVVPLEAGEALDWLSPATARFRAGQLPEAIRRELSLLADAARAHADQRWSDFAAGLAAFNRSLRDRLPQLQVPLHRIALEISYNRFEPFFKAQLAFGLVLLLFALSWVGWRCRLRRLSLLFLILGWIALTGGMIVRMLITGRPPVTNLYETFVFVGWAGAGMGLVLEAFQKRGLGILSGGLTGLVALTISGRFALEGDTMGMLAAVLDSNLWLSTHVVTIALGYAGCVVAGIIGHWVLVQALFPRADDAAGARTEKLLLASLAVGLAFTGIGTIMGGIWADQSWGRFWGWDPKENGALLIILWCAILFHSRRTGWLGRAGLAAGAIGAIVAVALTWLGINLLGQGMHAYGFTTGVGRGLAVFVLCELVFVTLAMMRIRGRRT
jgi:ABC-type transport system involved in cytochrome c biogenesis permease subunit